MVDPRWAKLGPSGGKLGPSWSYVEPNWGKSDQFRPKLRDLEAQDSQHRPQDAVGYLAVRPDSRRAKGCKVQI
eukprot:3356064-Karenia_brevis.AAC.1